MRTSPTPPTEPAQEAPYTERLRQTLRGLEQKRRTELRRARGTVGPGLLIGIPLIAFGTRRTGAPVASWILGGLAVGAPLWLAYRKLSRIRNEAHRHVMTAVCESFGLTFAQDADEFPLARYREYGLIPGYHRAALEDRIRGRVEAVEIDFCEATLEERYRTHKGHTRYRTVFRGVLLSLRFPQPFAGRTIVGRDAGALMNFLHRTAGWLGERVSLESPEFERVYEVYSDDQVDARYLLTPRFMERLVELARLFDSPPQLAFEGHRLELAAPSDQNRFAEPGLFSPFEDARHLQQLSREIQIVFDIIRTLELQRSELTCGA